MNYLRANPETYFSRKEIAKRAVHRTVYEENPHWCVAPLNALVELQEVEQNEAGHYKLMDKSYKSKFEKKY